MQPETIAYICQKIVAKSLAFVYEEVYSPRRQHTIITMTINEHAKTDMYIEHYIKYRQ